MKRAVDVLLSFFTFWFIYYLLGNYNHNIFCNLIILGMFAINVLIFVVDEYESGMAAQRCELAVRIKELEHQKENVEQIKARQLEMEKRNHDFDKAVMMLQDMLAQKKYEESEKLINALKQSSERYVEHSVYSSNVILNTLLNRKIEQCRQENIDVKCFVCGRVEGIDEVDLYYLFANLIDNAINAARESGKPYVSILINCSDTRLYAEIANSIRYTDKKTFDEIIPDIFPEGHGYGISNIRDIVEKYGGKLEYTIVNPSLLKVTLEMVKNNTGGEDAI